MTRCAILGESALHVIRIRRVLEIRHVTRDTRSVGKGVVVPGMASDLGASARRHHVSAGQGERGLRVVEVGRRPGRRVVARCASAGVESSPDMAWVGGIVEIVLVALDASDRRRQVVVVVFVAVGALARRNGVRTGQRGTVRERGPEPGVGGMAVLAGGRKLSFDVIWIFGRGEVLLMAAVTRRGHRFVVAESPVLVTVVAGGCSVGAGQREAVHVLIDLGCVDLPAADGVAGFAGRAHLAPMNVSVAVGALVAHIREHHLDVATGAGYALVHPTQCELRLVVVELGDGADRLPAVYGMAILAREVESAVGTMGVRGGLRLAGRNRRRQK